MSLFKKDFETIAEIIRNANALVDYNLAEEFADYLATKNAEFDRDKFLSACGVRNGI